MKNKYRKYTKENMKYLKFIHTPQVHFNHKEFKKILCHGFYRMWNYDDWDCMKTKSENRLLNYYYDHILGLND